MAKFRGSRFNDRISGTRHGDTIIGNAGNDHLSGKGGNDVIKGGAGSDLIVGGKGADSLFGGAGQDVFKFNVFEGAFHFDTLSYDDVIHDFNPNQDLIDVPFSAFAPQLNAVAVAQGVGTEVVYFDSLGSAAGTFLVVGLQPIQLAGHFF
jgi:Ca2+-binding RTX toxin-like protein